MLRTVAMSDREGVQTRLSTRVTVVLGVGARDARQASAIEDQGLAGHMVGPGEEEDGVGDVAGRANLAPGRPVQDGLACRSIGREPRILRPRDRARGDRVDAERRQLGREGPGRVPERRLGDAVVCVARPRVMRSEIEEVDDRAVVPQRGQALPNQGQRGDEVELQDAFEIGIGAIAKPSALERRRIVDEKLQPASRRSRARDHRLNQVLAVCGRDKVGGDDPDDPRVRRCGERPLLGQRMGLRDGVKGVDPHLVSRLDQSFDDGTPDADGSAGHEGHRTFGIGVGGRRDHPRVVQRGLRFFCVDAAPRTSIRGARH